MVLITAFQKLYLFVEFKKFYPRGIQDVETAIGEIVENLIVTDCKGEIVEVELGHFAAARYISHDSESNERTHMKSDSMR